MGWFKTVALLFLLEHALPSSTLDMEQLSNILPPPGQDFEENSQLQEKHYTDIENPGLYPLEQEKLDLLNRYLTEILVQPWPKGYSPLLFIETPANVQENEEYQSNLSDVPYKRSRYYRKYPWKRQNSRQTYEPENRYLCQPTKEDVFRLLVALHEAKQGTRGHTVNFCNRKRPAHAVFTNIRFLGKRK